MSPVVLRLNEVQNRFARTLKPLGFARKGRTFRRRAEDSFFQILALQAGPFEIGPPPPESVKHLRPDLYGKFTINLGVYVAETHERSNPALTEDRVLTDAHCAIRTRLGNIALGEDTWWNLASLDDDGIDDLLALILHVGIPFLERFKTRALIVSDWIAFNERERRLSNVARLDVAMILLKLGDRTAAGQLLQEQIKQTDLPHHAAYVRELAARLGLGDLT
jgi:hypothetical protein